MSTTNPDILWLLKALNIAYPHPPVRLDADTIAIWNMVLGCLNREELERGLTEYLRCDNPFFPRPGQIYSLARPAVDYETEATLVAEEVIALLGPCGPEAGERAMGKLSERGRAYIEQVGGWFKFSTSMQREQESNLGTIKAQMRKAIMGIQQRRTNATLALENKEVSLKSLGVAMKSIAQDTE